MPRCNHRRLVLLFLPPLLLSLGPLLGRQLRPSLSHAVFEEPIFLFLAPLRLFFCGARGEHLFFDFALILLGALLPHLRLRGLVTPSSSSRAWRVIAVGIVVVVVEVLSLHFVRLVCIVTSSAAEPGTNIIIIVVAVAVAVRI